MPLSFVVPQVPILVDQPPGAEGWIHEIKHDGFRAQIIVDRGGARLFTKRGHDWSARWAHLTRAASTLCCQSAIIDGEAVVQDRKGVSDFHALRAGGKPVYIAFDLLWLDGKDLRQMPLLERRELLRGLLGGVEGPVGFSEAWEGEGRDLLAAADEMRLEGIVSKLASSIYRSGPAKSWRKTKCWAESELTLIGIDKDRDGVPIALFARECPGGLQYAGSAMCRFPKEVSSRVERLRQLTRSPLLNGRPKAEVWFEPSLRVRVRHLKGEERLRHASVKGLAG